MRGEVFPPNENSVWHRRLNTYLLSEWTNKQKSLQVTEKSKEVNLYSTRNLIEGGRLASMVVDSGFWTQAAGFANNKSSCMASRE